MSMTPSDGDMITEKAPERKGFFPCPGVDLPPNFRYDFSAITSISKVKPQ
jgi:hypothetical protein